MNLNWLPPVIVGYMLGLLMAVIMDNIASRSVVVLEKPQWRCIEYVPNSAQCAVYERIGIQRE